MSLRSDESVAQHPGLLAREGRSGVEVLTRELVDEIVEARGARLRRGDVREEEALETLLAASR